VSRIITDIAVFDVDRTSAEGGLTLVELLNGSTVEEVKEKTDATFEIASGVQ
jgi:3-oxoacid CoA-transferase